jgi:hypothetical protein
LGSYELNLHSKTSIELAGRQFRAFRSKVEQNLSRPVNWEGSTIPFITYTLTNAGKGLFPVLDAMADWALKDKEEGYNLAENN